MTAITLVYAQAQLTAYLNAETKVLEGQSVRFGDRILTKVNLTEIRAGRLEWQQIVDQLTASASAIKHNRRVRFADWNNV